MRYRPHLDALRAFAALAVVLRHLYPLGPRSPDIAFYIRDWGALGVPLFFVLSGFLITGILLDARAEAEERGLSRRGVWARFWLRRALRIFPLYYATLALCLILKVGDLRDSWPWHALYLGNFRMAWDNTWPGSLSPLWSLAVEEQFYLVWPLLILALPRALLPWLMTSCLFVAPLWRIGVEHMLGDGHLASIVLLPACLDQLGAGALLAWLWRSDLPWRRPAWWIGLCSALATAAFLAYSLVAPVDSILSCSPIFLTCVGLASAWWIDAAARGFQGWRGRLASRPLLLYLGRISYGVYLLHYTVAFNWVAATFAYPSWSWKLFLGSTLCTLGLASLSWHYFEKPLLRLKKHLPYLDPP